MIEWYEDGAVELYNLREDLGEARNLVEAEPDRAQALRTALAAWRRDVSANMPLPNPDYAGNKRPVLT